MFRFTVGEALRKGTLIFYFSVATIILILFALGIGRMPNDPDVVGLFGSPLARQSAKDLIDFHVVDFILVMLHQQAISSIMLFGIFGIAGLVPKNVGERNH